jgi:hypothetical protein
MQNVTKLFPGWKEAVSQIVDRVGREGYGVMLSFENLFTMMDIQTPATATFEEWQKHQFEVLDNIENLKRSLLEDHNICLQNVRGQGYQVLHPDDQVTIAANKLFKKAMTKVRQAVEVITHVDLAALSFDGQQQQMRQLEKASFLHAVMSKKKIGVGGGAPLAIEE